MNNINRKEHDFSDFLALDLSKEEAIALLKNELRNRNIHFENEDRVLPTSHYSFFEVIANFFKRLFKKTFTMRQAVTKVAPIRRKPADSKDWTRRLTGRVYTGTIRSALPTMPISRPENFPPLRNQPTKGLPNFTVRPLANVCYINAAVQMIANIPGLQSVIENANTRNKNQTIRRLQTSLIALTKTIQNPSPEKEAINSCAVDFWRDFQQCLRETPMEGLSIGIGRMNDSGELLTYLGDLFDIPNLSMTNKFDHSLAVREAQNSRTSSSDTPVTGEVIVADIDERRSFKPKEFITLGGENYELCGIINHGRAHYTGCTKSSDGSWNNYNDSRITKNSLQHFGPRVVIYQKVPSN